MHDISRRSDRAHIALAFILGLTIAWGSDVKLAHSQTSEAESLYSQYQTLSEQGRYSEAIPLAQRVLAIREKSLGPGHLGTGQSLNDLAELYENQGRYADAEPLLKRSLAIYEKSLGPDHPNIATVLNNLASLYQHQRRYADAEALYRRSLTISEKALSPTHLSVAATLNNFAGLYQHQGRYADAEPLLKRSLAIYEKSLGPDHPDVATVLNNLASLYQHQGRYADAEPLFKRSLAITEKSLGPDHLNVAIVLNELSVLYYDQGRYAKAEPLFKRSLSIKEKTLGSNHPDVATSLNNLALLYKVNGQYADAEPLYKRALAINENFLGPNHPSVATALDNLAGLYRDQSRYSEAEPLQKRSLAIYTKVLGPNHPDVAIAENNLALLYYEQGQYTDAEPLYKRSLAIYEKSLGPDHPLVATALDNLAQVYVEQGQYADAEPLQKRSLAIYTKVLGPNHVDVVTALYNLAKLYRAQGRWAEALQLVRTATESGYVNRSMHLSVLLGARSAKYLSEDKAIAESFEVVQRASATAASAALSQLAVRFAAGSDDLALLVRKDQDLSAENQGLDKNLVAAFSKPPNQRDTNQEAAIRKRLEEIADARAQVGRILTQRFPDYAALSKLQPLSVAQTQALLVDDEALVVFDFDARSYAWVITKTEANWTELKVAAKELNAEVKTLRERLTSTGDKPFDTALSYQIYQSTFGAIAGKIASKTRLSLITNGGLTSLPSQLLITSDPTGRTLKDQAWLVRSYAITVLPTVASLKILRGVSATSSAAKPMIAFADPVFSKLAHSQATQQLEMRSITSFYDGTQIDVARLGEYLPQLPGTRAEVQAVGKTLKADPSDLKLGLNATVTAVKQAKLDQYRIVYFATHGLVSGELERFAKTKAEPALVLTIPDKPTDFDDGLLQASEIAQLKLNAEWVVLSACNTAAEEKPGAEALSGLARAFFYAGGRSLIVSHWQVGDASTARLMLGTFQASAGNARLSHAEALRQAMLEMIDDAKTDAEADPRLWAPFVVVGEPATQR